MGEGEGTHTVAWLKLIPFSHDGEETEEKTDDHQSLLASVVAGHHYQVWPDLGDRNSGGLSFA